MKKIISLTLVALLVVSMLISCSCAGNNGDTNTGSDTQTSTGTNPGTQDKPNEALPDDANDNTSFDNIVEF